MAHPGDGIDIVLADDHTMVRRGLRMVLDSEEGLRVVAEAGDIDAALRATRGPSSPRRSASPEARAALSG